MSAFERLARFGGDDGARWRIRTPQRFESDARSRLPVLEDASTASGARGLVDADVVDPAASVPRVPAFTTVRDEAMGRAEAAARPAPPVDLTAARRTRRVPVPARGDTPLAEGSRSSTRAGDPSVGERTPVGARTPLGQGTGSPTGDSPARIVVPVAQTATPGPPPPLSPAPPRPPDLTRVADPAPTPRRSSGDAPTAPDPGRTREAVRDALVERGLAEPQASVVRARRGVQPATHPTRTTIGVGDLPAPPASGDLHVHLDRVIVVPPAPPPTPAPARTASGPSALATFLTERGRADR